MEQLPPRSPLPGLWAVVLAGLFIGSAWAVVGGSPSLPNSLAGLGAGVAGTSVVLPGYTNQSYNASSDGWPLSYEEWLPAGYNPAVPYPMIVYLRGISTYNQTWVGGGVRTQLLDHLTGNNPQAVSVRALINNASADGFVLIAPNTRTGAGFFTNSPCGGPQQQDLWDAIHHEEALRAINTSAVYFIGTSAGAQGALQFVIQNPGVVRAVAIANGAIDLYEEYAFLQSQVARKAANASLNLQAIQGLTCGAQPSPTNASVLEVFDNLSLGRFDPQGLRGTPVYAIAGGDDTETPDNTHIWAYPQVNATFVSSSCLTATTLGEPENCTTTLNALRQSDPWNYSFRYVYEPNDPHGLGQLLSGDILNFFLGKVPGGLYVANGYPTGPIQPAPGLTYAETPPTHYTVQFAASGLAPGTNWTLAVDGGAPVATNASSLVVYLPNGTHSFEVGAPFGYTANGGGGFNVTGNDLNETVRFTAMPRYPVAINETGLPNGTTWAVSVTVAQNFSNCSSLALSLPNGTYVVSVPDVNNYSAQEMPASLSVDGAATSLNVTFALVTKYLVNVSELGLPNGTQWGLSIGTAAFASTAATIQVREPNGSFPFEAEVTPGFQPSPGVGVLTIAGQNVTLNVSYTAVDYTVDFAETGLAAGTNWSVTVDELTYFSTVNVTTVALPNGTYGYEVGSVFGYTGPGGGNVTVAGSVVSVALSFGALPTYTLKFQEGGLPAAVVWGVTVHGVTLTAAAGHPITFLLPSGSYPYALTPVSGYAGVPASGTAYLPATTLTVRVTFGPEYYPVAFHESGLPSGTHWKVSLGGHLLTSSSAWANFTVINGTYAYAFAPIGGWTVPASGNVSVAGAALVISASFALYVTYGVRFAETGLPHFTAWSVLVNGVNHSVTGSGITLALANGTYAYRAFAAGYNATPANGTVTVNGTSLTVRMSFGVVGSLPNSGPLSTPLAAARVKGAVPRGSGPGRARSLGDTAP